MGGMGGMGGMGMDDMDLGGEDDGKEELGGPGGVVRHLENNMNMKTIK